MTRPVLLVTGASSGIGAATARLAAPTYDLALGFHSNRAGIDEVARDCTAAGAKVHLLQADLSDPDGVDALFEGFDAVFDRLDGLVNNAGVVDVAERVDEFEAPRLRRMLDTNLLGPILVAGRAVRRMSTAQGHGGGGIVNISSAAARLGGATQYVDYAATKAAIDLFTKGLAEEVAAEGIRVNAVRPGLILTPIHEKGGQPGRAERLAPNVPMRRAGTAEEVAETILWLLSPAASYVTASVIDCAGGR